MKVISKPAVLWKFMHDRMRAKKWNFEAVDRATGTKTGFNCVISGATKDMKLATILRLLAVLDLELVVQRKAAEPKRPRTYVPTDALPGDTWTSAFPNALPMSAAQQEEVPEA